MLLRISLRWLTEWAARPAPEAVDGEILAETIQYGALRERALDELTDAVGAVDARLQRRQAATEAAGDALVLASSLAMLGVGLSLVSAGELSLPDAFVATFTFFSSFGPVMAVGRLGASLQATLASGARVPDLLDETPECADVEDGVDVEFCGASMEGVSFSYAGCGRAERILSDITCEFSAGQMVCVSGRSGSGKSTLLKLLMRFVSVEHGRVS